MNPNNPVIKLCIEGTQAEFAGRLGDACKLYRQAWETSTDSYEACIAAHYVARCQETVEEMLRWNQKALDLANRMNDEKVRDFYPSLYLNLGYSYELLGEQDKAKAYYELAAGLGFAHQMD